MKGSVDEKREMIKEPLLKDSPKGGFITMPFIIANGMLEKVASYGLMPNMTLYLMSLYNMEMTAASNILYYWTAATNFMPVVGAIAADSYVGRFNMIGFGSVVSLLGTVLLWLSAMMPGIKPQPCNESVSHCSSTTIPQLLLLCSSLAILAIGAGGIRSSSLAFGADQLQNEDHNRNGVFMERFYGWYYATYMLAILIGNTCVVYIQDQMGWEFGFGVAVALMLFSTIWFFLGTPFYVKAKAKANLLTELIQVIVASCKKWHITSSSGKFYVYHQKKGSALLFPTEKFRFLNKACIAQDPQQELTPDGTARDPWSLCTVDQVEDLKSLLKVIPIWSTGMITFINMSQSSFSVLQATSMNRKLIGNFEIPAGSFGTFSIISLILWVPLYDGVILPLISRIRGKPVKFSAKQRMGAGIFLSFICMMVTGTVEVIRRRFANQNGYSNNPGAMMEMSALWLVPQYCLSGTAEALIAIAQSEFYIAEFPKSMSSIASTLCSVGMSVANLLASFLMSTIDDVTKRGGSESWVSTNINKGRYDYYFWVLSGLSLVNFMYYLLCCWNYGPCRGEEEKAREEDILV